MGTSTTTITTTDAAVGARTVSERVLGVVLFAAGALLFYLVLFDQGAVLDALLGHGAGRTNYLHEFFHDGRHVFNAPCH